MRRQQLDAIAADRPVAVDQPPTTASGSRWPWVALIAGLLVTSLGGLRATGLLVLLVCGDISITVALLHGLAVAVPGMILGVLLFGLAIGRLNRSSTQVHSE